MNKHILVLTILTFMIAACGGQQTAETEAPVETPESSEEIAAEDTEEEDEDSFDQEALIAYIEHEQESIEACYQTHLEHEPEASGKVEILLVITASETRGEIVLNEVGGDVGQCIADILGQALFEGAPDDNDDPAHVTVPFHFAPGQ